MDYWLMKEDLIVLGVTSFLIFLSMTMIVAGIGDRVHAWMLYNDIPLPVMTPWDLDDDAIQQHHFI